MQIDAMKIEKPILPREMKNGAKLIIADPPWDVLQKGAHGAIRHYDLMTLDQIMSMPVESLAAENSVLALWCTAATLPNAYEIMEKWGFMPRAPFVWVKNRMGLGVYMRNYCEFFILGTRGKALPAIKNQPNVGLFPVQDHSHKPEEIYDILERMYPEGPKLELFARRPRYGWLAWGNQISSDIVIPGYPVPEYSEKLKEELAEKSAGKEDE